jgi:hypothetical protein
MIVFNAFSLESYYAQNSTLIIDECKTMTRIARYMIQREFANFIIKRQHAINEWLKLVWSWIKNDKVWKEFHKKFEEFEDDYSNIVSLIWQTRDFIKLKQEVVITIINEWEFNVKCLMLFLFTRCEQFANARSDILSWKRCKWQNVRCCIN